MLVHLPLELLCHVYHHLPQSSVNQVSLTCRSLHASALPALYAIVVLSFRTHIRQLEAGLQKSNGILKHILQQHTKELVLKCKQSGHHRLLFDIRSLMSQLPHLRSLSLVDFHMLPVAHIFPLLSHLPHLDTVSIRYCDLIADLPSSSRLSSSIHLPTSQQRYQYEQLGELKRQPGLSVTTLEFYWTDFSKAAMTSILSVFPSLTKVRLLANHNRHYLANNYALEAIQQRCPSIVDLEIGLQEVKEQALVNCITHYGTQLQRLSIRYHSPLTLFAISKYASLVQDLTVRFSLETKWYPSTSLAPSSTPPTQRIPRLPYATTTRSRLHQQQQQQEVEQEIRKKGALLCVFHQCHRLVRVQVESMCPSQSRDNLPPVVRKALAVVAQKRITLNGNIQQQAFNNNVIQNNDNKPFSVLPHHHEGATEDQEPKSKSTTTTVALATNLAPRKPSTTTTTGEITAIDRYQQEEEEENRIDNNGLDMASVVHHGDTNNIGEEATNTEIAASPYAVATTNPQLTSGFQQYRPWRNQSHRIATILILDNEQLKEIRSQALPFI